MRLTVLSLYALLLAANAAAWLWAGISIHAHPILLASAVLAYTFGLRHAVDADHIAAIDNVTRKLMQQGERPLGVGLMFSLGHSTIVVALTVGIALLSTALKAKLAPLAEFTATFGTIVSAAFLFAIAAANVFVFAAVYRTFAAARDRGVNCDAELENVPHRHGLLGRAFHGVFNLVGKSWQMYFVGLLFGLGFDTATEIGLLGLSAKSATGGMSLGAVLLFPVLFTAAMTLVDTTDGLLMVGAYNWARVHPLRKLRYNLIVTGASILIAVVIGGIELAGLAADRIKPAGRVLNAVAALNDHLGQLGLLVIAIFVLTWAGSAALSARRSN